MSDRREQLEAQLSAYLDGELTLPERAEIEAWLAQDAEARALLADLEQIATGLRSLPRARASGDMLEAVQARMERNALIGEPEKSAHGRMQSRSPGLRWAAAAAIVLMTSAGGYVTWLLNTRENTNPQFAMVADQPARPADRLEAGAPQRETTSFDRLAKSAPPARAAPRSAGIEALTDRVVPAPVAEKPAAPVEAASAVAKDDRLQVPVELALKAAEPAASPSLTKDSAPGNNLESSAASTRPATVLEVALADRSGEDRLIQRLESQGLAVTKVTESPEARYCAISNEPSRTRTRVGELDVVAPSERARHKIVAQLRAEPVGEPARDANIHFETLADSTRSGSEAASKARSYAYSRPAEVVLEQPHHEIAYPDATSWRIISNESSSQPSRPAMFRANVPTPAVRAAASPSPTTREQDGEAPADYYIVLNIRVADHDALTFGDGAVQASRAQSAPAGAVPLADRPASQPVIMFGAQSRPASHTQPGE